VVPDGLRRGTATVDEALDWCRKVHYFGEPDSFDAKEVDFDGDGVMELAVYAASWQGTGGNLYLVFKQGEDGLRFFDVLSMGGFRRVMASEIAHCPRIVTIWRIGMDHCEIGLLKVLPAGFEKVSSKLLQRKECDVLTEANVLPADVIEQIFDRNHR
jgi:hypothetical protein